MGEERIGRDPQDIDFHSGERTFNYTFGYDTAVFQDPNILFDDRNELENGNKVIELKGVGTSLKIGEVHRIKAGPGSEPVGGGAGEAPFKDGDSAEIMELAMPFSGFRTDDIVRVRVGNQEAWIKPSKIEEVHS